MQFEIISTCLPFVALFCIHVLMLGGSKAQAKLCPTEITSDPLRGELYEHLLFEIVFNHNIF